MAEWMAQTDRFVTFNERGILQGAGRASHAHMEKLVHERFDAFDERHRAAAAEAAEQQAVDELSELEQQSHRLPQAPVRKKPTTKS